MASLPEEVAQLVRQSRGALSVFEGNFKNSDDLPHFYGELELGTPHRLSEKKSWKHVFCVLQNDQMRVYTPQKKYLHSLRLEGSKVHSGKCCA